MNMQEVVILDLGCIPYAKAWELQTGIHQQLIAKKRSVQKGESVADPIHHHFLLCEHFPVFTLGKSGTEDHLRMGPQEREAAGFDYFKINRGGDITYHGPGQIVGYPILDLEAFYCDVHRYVRDLEEVIIRVLADYGLQGIRVPGYTGVWLEADSTNQTRKICAIGVHISRWVTLHGFAFNINTDLSHFQHIIPCGIKDDDKEVTSLESELKRHLDLDEVKNTVIKHFGDVFGCTTLKQQEIIC